MKRIAAIAVVCLVIFAACSGGGEPEEPEKVYAPFGEAQTLGDWEFTVAGYSIAGKVNDVLLASTSVEGHKYTVVFLTAKKYRHH